jgi:hypothetical protein
MAYFGFTFGPELPFTADQTAFLVKSTLATLISFLAGVVGVFVAILVTASIVPQMFEPGAIDLLLSKPVSRSLLLRDFGACVHSVERRISRGRAVVDCGTAVQHLERRLLLCIPVLLFLFVIYYSVSALAGVIWRNAVVSVIITILFWFACFSVGTTKTVIETAFLNGTRLTSVVQAGETLLVVNKSGQTFAWDAVANQWREVFAGKPADFRQMMMPNNLIGPVYDSRGERIVAVETSPSRFDLLNGPGKLLVGQKGAEWARIQGAATPNGVGALFIDSESVLLTAGSSGIHRLKVTSPPSTCRCGFDRIPAEQKGRAWFVDIGPKLTAREQTFQPRCRPMAPVAVFTKATDAAARMAARMPMVAFKRPERDL